MVCITYHYVVCHACYIYTDIMHASYYGAYIDDYAILQTLSTCNLLKESSGDCSIRKWYVLHTSIRYAMHATDIMHASYYSACIDIMQYC